jgi:hypothetical protein
MPCPCSGTTSLQPGAQAFIDWLRSRTDLIVGEGIAVSVDGRPATSVEVTAAPGAEACANDWVRMWQTRGNDSVVAPDGVARVVVLDVGDTALAIEMWGTHQDEWLPLAQRIVDTIDLTE